MSPNAALTSISSETRAARAAWLTMLRERFYDYGRGGYFAIWVIRPMFDLAIAALIYAGGRADLIPYLVVALTANSVVWTTLFWVGEILDRERMRGTLLPLFLTPCSRLSWLIGFAAAGIVETGTAAVGVAVVGSLLFDVRFNPNVVALAVTIPLYVLSLAGLGLLLSAIGLVIKKANQLANLVFPFITLLGGVYYPVAELPTALRIPARALPLGYGMEALAAAALNHAPLHALLPSLLPLAGFAIALPVLGAIAFRVLERLVRRRGEIDLY